MRSSMGVWVALILALSMSVWGQSTSSSVDTQKPTVGQAEVSSTQNDKPNGAEGKTAPSPAVSPATVPTPAVQNHVVPKKHNRNPLPEQTHPTPATAPAEVKTSPLEIPRPPLDPWIRAYLLVTAALALFGLCALVLMWRQLAEMRAAREQSDKLGRRASEQVAAIREAAELTDRLILQVAEQARIAEEQAKVAAMTACATKSSSDNFAQIANSSVHNVQFAQEAMRLEQRAWVFLTDIRAGELQVGKAFTINLGFKNTGRTPARNVQIAAHIDPLPKGQAPEPRLDKAYSRGIIPPEGTVYVNVGNGRNHVELVSQEELQAISSGELVMWVYGTLTYEDVFEFRQATMFCYRLQPDGRTFAVAEVYNDAT